jgi:hypothetical protein
VLSSHKLLVTQQSALVYLLEDPSEEDLLKEFASRVKQTYGSIGRGQRAGLSRLQYGYDASVFPCWPEALPAQDCVKTLS